MSLPAVVRKDFRDGMRSKLLWVLMAFFLLTIGGFSALAARDASSEAGSASAATDILGLSAVLAILFLIPITGLVVSVKSVVRERELGSLKILLSLPHTRLEVVLGKFVGRAGLMTTAILAGFLPAALILWVGMPGFELANWLTTTFGSLLFGVAFVAIGIGVSALMETETRATASGILVFFVLYFWALIFGWLNDKIDLLDGELLVLIERFHLYFVWQDITTAIAAWRGETEIENTAALGGGLFKYGVTDLDPTAAQPFYLEHWFAFVIVALWIVVPLAVGYYQFERSDL